MTLPNHDRPLLVLCGVRRARRALLMTATSLLLLLSAALVLTPGASAQPATRTILILTGSDPNHPGFSVLTQRVRSVVRDGSRERVELHYELQEGLIRPPDSPQDDKELANYLKRKYAGENISLILAAAAPRLRILLKNDPELFKDVPKVFYEFEEEREPIYRDLGPNITGVWARIDHSRTLELALSLHPNARRVVVVSGSSAEAKAIMERVRAEFRRYEGRVEVVYLTDMTLAELKERLATLPGDSIVYYLLFFIDKAGNRYPGAEALSAVAPTSAAPIYGDSASYLGQGIVGGSLIDFEAIGQRLGEVCLRVLNGEKPGEITSQTAPNVTMLDWRELQRWGISEEKLPPGSVVKFKEFSFWELYKWYIVGTVAACIIEALLIVYLLLVQRRRRRAERERERLTGLVEAEHRHLNETVSNVPGIVWETLIDPQTETRGTKFISDYVEEMLGYTSAEWLSSPDGFGYRLMPGEDRERAARASEEVMKSGKQSLIQHRWRAKDGRTVWVESHLSPMVDEAGKVVGLRGVSIDITEKKLAEDARRQSEERNLATLRAIPDLMFLQTRDGVYLDYHARDTKELYLPPEAFIGKNIRDVMPPELAEMFLERFSLVEETGDPHVVEYDLDIGGEQRWYEARIVRSGDDILSVVRDITERKRAEIAVRDAMAASERDRAQLESVFQAVADGIIVTDMAGTVLLVNEANGRIHGYESPDEMKLTVAEFAPNYELFDSDGRLIPYEEWPLSKVLRGESVADWELRVRRKDLVREWFFSYTGEPVRDERGEQVMALLVTHDITERKAAEVALRESEERYRTLFESIDEGFCVFEMIYDGDGRAVDAVFTASNPAFERLTGWKDANGKRFSELIPDLEEFWFQHYARIAAAGEPDRFTGRAAALDKWFDVYAFRVGEEGSRTVAVIFSDVTERIRSVEALRQSEERFRNMADTTPVLIWIAGTDKLCTYFNKQWLVFTGRSIEEELGYGWAVGIHPEDYARCIEVYTSSFDRREPFRMEYRLRRADGSYRWVLDTGTPRFSSAGEFLGYIGSAVDIHDRKESEEALHSVMEEVSRLKNQLQEENIYLREEIKLEHNFSEIVGRSDAIKYVLHKVEQVGPTDSTVLITGETGTGKELVARAIHGESHRHHRPLVKVNCAALSPGLIESELFGHERGAFTGAVGRKVGRFELADGATIFLDEIGELPLELQAKLLRVIQEGEFERLGANRTLKADVRIIAATNRNLWKEVQAGAFREDLFYRLNVFPITMPPLRQHAEDIPLLVEHFVASFSRKMGKKLTSISPATLNALRNYPWPGNVRELANVIERAVINNSGPVLQISNLAETLRVETPSAPSKTLEEIEREYIITVLDGAGWRIEGQHGAARILGLHPSTLRTRMAKLRIHNPHTNSK